MSKQAGSSDRYQQLFDRMLEGFALHEIVTDDSGTPVDYRFLEVNPAFEHLTGLRAADVVGRCASQVLPGLESEWIERYGRVALTGEPIRFEQNAAALGRWYSITAYCPAPRMFATLFTDVTALRATAERLRLHAALVDGSSTRWRRRSSPSTPRTATSRSIAPTTASCTPSTGAIRL